MKKLTVEAKQCAAIERRIRALYKQYHTIEKLYADKHAPAKKDDVVWLRDQLTSRICYYKIVEITAYFVEDKQQMTLRGLAFRCTKTGLRRGNRTYLSSNELARITKI